MYIYVYVYLCTIDQCVLQLMMTNRTLIIDKFILKSYQRVRSKEHNVFIEEVNKTALSANYDKRIQSIDSIETYAYGINKVLVSKKKRN